MPGTMTYVGFDVHARSTHAAAIDVMTGELTRVRFGAGVQAPVDWLTTLSDLCQGPETSEARSVPSLGDRGPRRSPGGCRSRRSSGPCGIARRAGTGRTGRWREPDHRSPGTSGSAG